MDGDCTVLNVVLPVDNAHRQEVFWPFQTSCHSHMAIQTALPRFSSMLMPFLLSCVTYLWCLVLNVPQGPSELMGKQQNTAKSTTVWCY